MALERAGSVIPLLVIVLCGALTVSAGSASAEVVPNPVCTLYADPTAAPGGSGQELSPISSFQALARALGPGETGCLAASATFNENVDLSGKSGTADKPIRIMSLDPLHPATLEGVPGSQLPRTLYFGTDTNYYEIAGINIRGHKSATNSAAVVINGTGNRLVGDDITHDLTTCVLIGQFASQRASGTVLDGNAVHTCGAPGGKANGIGVSTADGTVIHDGYVYGNPAHGIELYPDADGTSITNNVIDGQGNGMGDGFGVQFAGGTSTSSDNNVVARNIISNNETKNIGVNWEGPVGSGNVVRENCVYSTKPNGNYQTDPPVGGATPGYTVEPNNVEGVDPQYQNRLAPPAGFALAASSPCLGKGPLPASTTGGALPAADPEAVSVFSVALGGDVNSRFQPATYRFDLEQAGNVTQGPGSNLAAAPLPLPVAGGFDGLKPSTEYKYRLIAANNSGESIGVTKTFVTPSEPPIAPLPLVLTYSHKQKGNGHVLSHIVVGALPRGATAEVTCSGSRRCPFKVRPLSDRKLLEGRAFEAGTHIQFNVRGTRTGRYLGRAVALTVKNRGRVLDRKDGCVAEEATLFPCLSVSRRLTLDPTRPRLNYLRATSIPTGATVSVACSGKGCPRLPGCRIVAGKSRDLLNLVGSGLKRQRFRLGNTIVVRIQKPMTLGLVVRIALKRGNSVASRFVQTAGFSPPNTKIPKPCQDA